MDKSVGEWFNLTGTGSEVQDAPYYLLLAGIALVLFFLLAEMDFWNEWE